MVYSQRSWWVYLLFHSSIELISILKPAVPSLLGNVMQHVVLQDSQSLLLLVAWMSWTTTSPSCRNGSILGLEETCWQLKVRDVLEHLDLPFFRKMGPLIGFMSSLTLQTFCQPTGGCYVTSGHRASRSFNKSLQVEKWVSDDDIYCPTWGLSLFVSAEWVSGQGRQYGVPLAHTCIGLCGGVLHAHHKRAVN